MPVIRSSTHTPSGADEHQLIREIVAEIGTPLDPNQPLRQPIIVENELGQTKTLHVAVIWERWKLVPGGDRARIIMRAYEDAESNRADQITIALGATFAEAIDLGLLPYGVVSTIKQDDGVPMDELRSLMCDEGDVQTSSGPTLRFPSEELASATCQRLGDKSKREYWALVHYPVPA